jgi:hypothetical protein
MRPPRIFAGNLRPPHRDQGPANRDLGPGGSAGTILFEREPEQFGELGSRVNASVLVGSNGRFDKVLDAAAGNQLGYVRFIGNQSHSDDYKDGNNDTVPRAMTSGTAMSPSAGPRTPTPCWS